MKKLSNFINGKTVESTSDETTTLINPATAQPFATAPKSNAADVDLAMKSAAAAFEGGEIRRHRSANAHYLRSPMPLKREPMNL